MTTNTLTMEVDGTTVTVAVPATAVTPAQVAQALQAGGINASVTAQGVQLSGISTGFARNPVAALPPLPDDCGLGADVMMQTRELRELREKCLGRMARTHPRLYPDKLVPCWAELLRVRLRAIGLPVHAAANFLHDMRPLVQHTKAAKRGPALELLRALHAVLELSAMGGVEDEARTRTIFAALRVFVPERASQPFPRKWERSRKPRF